MSHNVVGYSLVTKFPELADFLLQQIAGLVQTDLGLPNGSILRPTALYAKPLTTPITTSVSSAPISTSSHLGLNNNTLYKIVFKNSSAPANRYCATTLIDITYTQTPIITGSNISKANSCRINDTGLNSASVHSDSNDTGVNSAQNQRFVTTVVSNPYNPYGSNSCFPRKNSHGCNSVVVLGYQGAQGCQSVVCTVCCNPCDSCTCNKHCNTDFSCLLFRLLREDLMAQLCTSANQRLHLLSRICVISTTSQSSTGSTTDFDQQVTVFLIQFTDNCLNYQAKIQTVTTIQEFDVITNANSCGVNVCPPRKNSFCEDNNHKNNNNNNNNTNNTGNNVRNWLIGSAIALSSLAACTLYTCSYPCDYNNYNSDCGPYYCGPGFFPGRHHRRSSSSSCSSSSSSFKEVTVRNTIDPLMYRNRKNRRKKSCRGGQPNSCSNSVYKEKSKRVTADKHNSESDPIKSNIVHQADSLGLLINK